MGDRYSCWMSLKNMRMRMRSIFHGDVAISYSFFSPLPSCLYSAVRTTKLILASSMMTVKCCIRTDTNVVVDMGHDDMLIVESLRLRRAL